MEEKTDQTRELLLKLNLTGDTKGFRQQPSAHYRQEWKRTKVLFSPAIGRSVHLDRAVGV
jgi:hypothetical protein